MGVHINKTCYKTGRISTRDFTVGMKVLQAVLGTRKSWWFIPINVSSTKKLTKYRKAASSRMSRLVAHFHSFRLFMKGNFDAYVLWPLDEMVQNWTVDQSTTRNFTVNCKWLQGYLHRKHKQSGNPSIRDWNYERQV